MILAIVISLTIGFGLGWWTGKKGTAAVSGDIAKAASDVEKKV